MQVSLEDFYTTMPPGLPVTLIPSLLQPLCNGNRLQRNGNYMLTFTDMCMLRSWAVLAAPGMFDSEHAAHAVLHHFSAKLVASFNILEKQLKNKANELEAISIRIADRRYAQHAVSLSKWFDVRTLNELLDTYTPVIATTVNLTNIAAKLPGEVERKKW